MFSQFTYSTVELKLRVTDLTPDAISCGRRLLWSALAVECEETSHLSHFTQNETFALKLHYFLQDAECSAKSQTRETGENH